MAAFRPSRHASSVTESPRRSPRRADGTCESPHCETIPRAKPPCGDHRGRSVTKLAAASLDGPNRNRCALDEFQGSRAGLSISFQTAASSASAMASTAGLSQTAPCGRRQLSMPCASVVVNAATGPGGPRRSGSRSCQHSPQAAHTQSPRHRSRPRLRRLLTIDRLARGEATIFRPSSPR